MSIAVTGLPSCARGLVSAPAPAPSSRIGPFVAVTRAVILLIVGVWVRKFWPSSCRPPWDERGMFALQERRMERAEHREKMGAQDRRSETRMVSRMDDARSVQRGAPLGAAVADSKRVRRSEHANHVTHAKHHTRRQDRSCGPQELRD